jgi:phenylalanyl-tRNA synthetase beta chain
MRAPLSWLQSLTPLDVSPTDRAAVADLASELDALGLVVEGVERVGEGLSAVVLAQVVEIAPIEGADRIRRVVVDRGGERTEVVCGAWNFEVGDVVPLAPVGVELPGGFRIERRKMKGVASNGMLCSARELDLGDDHEGILVVARPESPGQVPTGVELGRTLAEHLGFGEDVVFDLAIEANRPDCLCMLGVARDLAARFDLPLHTPVPRVVEAAPAAVVLASVKVLAPELCRRLTARVLTGVSRVRSPALIQRRLVLAGMRPIDCVVDASNYVMLELGQPTHPYDLDELGGRGLTVRAARHGETIVTLDGETRTLGLRPPRRDDPSSGLDALICTADDVPVGIAGVMGGRSSEISDRTTSVLLEVAEFVPVAVGRTVRWLGLRTEASARFERGVDPEGVERAGDRVCELIAEAAVAAGVLPPVVAAGLLDDRPVPFEPARVRVRPSRVNSLLGTELTADDMTALLEPIGYRQGAAPAPGADGASVLDLEAPSWRPDVGVEVDVIEDVARTFGYRRIPRTERRSPHVGRLDEVQQLRRRVRRVLSGLGAHEAWTSSIVDPAGHRRAGLDGDLVQLTNPMVTEETALRAGLLPGLLTAVRHNSAHRWPFLRLFELGDVFAPTSGKQAGTDEAPGAEARPPDALLPAEHERVALVLARQDDSAAAAVNAWRVLADVLGITGVDVNQDLNDRAEAMGLLVGLHPARSGWLVVSGTPDGRFAEGEASGAPVDTLVGTVGEVDPEVLAAYGLPHERVGWLDLSLGALAAAPRRSALAQPVSRYPSSDVDLAFSLDNDVPAARLEALLRKAASELCEAVWLFDVYRGAGVDEGTRSLAYRLRFCAPDHTLTDNEVAELRQACIAAVELALPAKLRA